MALDKNQGFPLYQQIIADLKTRISNGEYSDYGRIPTEKELCQQYGVSRITVRRAISIMEDTGIVHKRQGFGTVYTAKLEAGTPPYMCFSQTCRINGHEPGAIFHDITIRPATEEEQTAFRQPDMKCAALMTRVRTMDGFPVLVEKVVMPSAFAAYIEKEPEGSYTDILRQNGVIVHHSQRTIEICYADESEAKYLGVPAQSPLLLIREVLYSRDHDVLSLTKNVITTNRFPYFL